MIINYEVMLRGFNAGNMPGLLDTKMIFWGEFLYVKCFSAEKAARIVENTAEFVYFQKTREQFTLF